MRLRTRLLLLGAVLPVALLLAVVAAGGALFAHRLMESIDRTLLAQATVEAVSLFDAPGGGPHLHLEGSPLATGAASAAATTMLYGPDGALVVSWPDHADVPARFEGTTAEEPVLRTVSGAPGAADVRELTVGIRSPEDEPYALRLHASLGPHDDALRAYWRSAGLLALLAAAVLLAIQVRHARSLGGRIHRLAGHMTRLQRGDLSGEPPPDDVGDVLSDLRDAVADATRKLRAARESEERFIADAAHELRTPLATMRTNVDVTLRRPREAPELRVALEEVREEVDRLAWLAGRLLDMASLRRARLRLEDDDLADVVGEATEAARTLAAERGVDLTIRLPGGASATFDRAAVRQVVDNLVDNALEHAPAGTRVEVVLAEAGDAWRLTVDDQGPGVPESERETIFEPFHKVRSGDGGTGLGLAIVRDVVAQHGGAVRALDRPGGPGARFEVLIPRRPTV